MHGSKGLHQNKLIVVALPQGLRGRWVGVLTESQRCWEEAGALLIDIVMKQIASIQRKIVILALSRCLCSSRAWRSRPSVLEEHLDSNQVCILGATQVPKVPGNQQVVHTQHSILESINNTENSGINVTTLRKLQSWPQFS